MSVNEARLVGPGAVAPVQIAEADQPVATINIRNMKFEVPEHFTVRPGQTVEFVNLDHMAHTVSADNTNAAGDPLFDIDIAPGSRGRITFTAQMLGTQTFYCGYHPSMHGTIIVQADSALASPDVREARPRGASASRVPTAALSGLAVPDAAAASARVRLDA